MRCRLPTALMTCSALIAPASGSAAGLDLLDMDLWVAYSGFELEGSLDPVTYVFERTETYESLVAAGVSSATLQPGAASIFTDLGVIGDSVAVLDGVAKAEYDDPAGAAVRVASGATLYPNTTTGYASPGLAEAGATLAYGMDVVGAAPTAVSKIPMTYSVLTGGFVDPWPATLYEGATSWRSHFQLFLGDDPFFDVDRHVTSYGVAPPASGSALVELSGSILYPVATAPATIMLDVACRSLAEANHEARCDAFMGPIFAFDQAAFDAMMGGNTFILSDYFDIAYTPVPGPAPVPLPPAAAALASAVGLMAAWRLARRKAAGAA